jgi:hypothetical protein
MGSDSDELGLEKRGGSVSSELGVSIHERYRFFDCEILCPRINPTILIIIPPILLNHLQNSIEASKWQKKQS